MSFNPRTRAANDLIASLKRRNLIELKTSDAELGAEIEGLLESYDRRLAKPSSEVNDALAADLATLLLESDNVDEMYADDAELSKLVNAALIDYIDAIVRHPPPATKRNESTT